MNCLAARELRFVDWSELVVWDLATITVDAEHGITTEVVRSVTAPAIVSSERKEPLSTAAGHVRKRTREFLIRREALPDQTGISQQRIHCRGETYLVKSITLDDTAGTVLVVAHC